MKSKLIRSIFAGLLAGAMLLAGCTTTGDSSTPAAESTAPAAEGPQDGASAPEATPTDGKKIVRVNNQSEPGSLHPSLAQGTHDSWPLNHMFEGLYEKAEDGSMVLAAASDVEVSEDGLVWTFTIDPNSKWSNGDALTAQDFISSFNYCLDPANAAKYSTQLYVLKNAEAVNKGEMDASELGAKVTEDGKLELTLNNPLPYLPDLLTHYTFYPVHTATQEQYPDWATSAEHYVSNGAFVLTEWKNKESMTLEKNPHFRRASDVKLDGMFFTINEDIATAWQMFQNGELDALYPLPTAVIEQLNTAGDPQLHLFDDLSTYYYYFNTTRKPFNNVKVRRALAMSIDRTAICEAIMKGGERPAYGLTPPGVPDVSGDYQSNFGDQFTEDVEAAKALLEEGLAEEGMTVSDFKFTILYNTLDSHRLVAEAVQAMWKQNLGVDVDLENAEFQVVLDRRKAGDFDVCRAGWIGDYADPMTFVELFSSWSEFNDCKWFNDTYDAHITTALESADNNVRMTEMKAAETLLMEEMPIMPIYFYTQPWVVSERLTGYFKPVNRYCLLYYADFVE